MNRDDMKIKPPPECLSLPDDGIDPGPHRLPMPTLIEVHGREQHESMLKDHEKMLSLGLDPYYETMVYLHRWGGWLQMEKNTEFYL
jgi:hypothetical protein